MEDKLQDKLQAEIERLKKELAEARTSLRRAKDPTPVKRPSLKRLIAFVTDACMEIVRVASGWELRFGKLKRRFRFLREIWEIFTAEDWFLSDIFPPEPQARTRPRLPLRRPTLAPAFGVTSNTTSPGWSSSQDTDEPALHPT